MFLPFGLGLATGSSPEATSTSSTASPSSTASASSATSTWPASSAISTASLFVRWLNILGHFDVVSFFDGFDFFGFVNFFGDLVFEFIVEIVFIEIRLFLGHGGKLSDPDRAMKKVCAVFRLAFAYLKRTLNEIRGPTLSIVMDSRAESKGIWS